MTSRDSPVTEDELHAFVDGQLPADRLDAVEAWLASHPDDAAMVATWHAQADAIRARFGEVNREPVPDRLKLGNLLRERRNWRAIAAVAAALAFSIGGVAGWTMRGTEEIEVTAADPADRIAQDALNAHKLFAGEMRHPVEVNAGEDHLLPWLSRRLDTPLRIPDFSAFDLKLLGARLLPGPSAPAAQFMFESSNGERITFYCSRLGQDQAALRYYLSDHIAAVRWVVGGYGYVVSGPADKTRLKELAKSAFEQLENRAPPRPAPRSSGEPIVSRRGG